MYTPKLFAYKDDNEVYNFMKQYSFATIVTSNNNIPVATHLPFTVTKRGEQIIVTSHFAKANPQWNEVTDNKVLVIFAEPHAYISPKHYDSPLSVPTWNYISVHAYGNGKIIANKMQAFEVLENMIDTYDSNYKKQWSQLPEDYKLKMLNGIIAFEIVISELQVTKKLSQNKTEAEQLRIIDTLSASENTSEKQIAACMKENLK
ncbi:MAG: FMN-binding negative transcriptional regulator [Sphingobacteriales bacterium]|nr:FMN-binding negative transcriptional regulator [Sphingobacteriales bacterium]